MDDKDSLNSKRFDVLKEMNGFISSFAESKAKEIIDSMRKEEISGKLIKLFEIDNKKDLKKYCSSIVIDQDEFGTFVFNIDKLGYKHALKSRQFVPEHLDISDEDLDVLFGNKDGKLDHRAMKVMRKFSAIFRERKVNHCHLFEKDDEWHIFYFSFAETDEDSHWKHGPHIHFVNHLWPSQDKYDLWQSFDNRRYKNPNSFHIRFNWNRD